MREGWREGGNPSCGREGSSFLSFHQDSYVLQIVPSQCLAQPKAMPLAVARSWGEQAVSIMGQTSRCCMVCLMPQSHVSCSLKNPHFITYLLLTGQPVCTQPVECLPGCPGILYASWEVFVRADVKVHTGVQGLESFSP